MRVLHVYRTYLPEPQGGVVETIRQICRSTMNAGVESRVLTLADTSERSVLERDEATVIRYPRNFEIASCDLSLQALLHFGKEAGWADIVHYHHPWPYADFMHLASLVETPAIMTYHSDIVRQKKLDRLYRPLMKRFLGEMKTVIATSRNYLSTSDVLASYRDKVEVVPIGIDPASYPVVDNDVLARMRARVGENFFLFVGVMRYYKGLHILVEAMKDIDLPVVIAGIGVSESELRKKADQYRLRNMHFMGHVTDEEKVALLNLSRAVVFPSYMRSEAFGVTLVEGAMFSKPLVSAEIGTGTSYVNLDGVTGIVASPGDPGSLKEAMLRLWQDNEMVHRMGKSAHERFNRLFTARIMGKRYAEIYERTVAG